MRADKEIELVKEGEPKYNYETGNYESGIITKHTYYGLVTDTSNERMSLLYGGIRSNSKTVRLNVKIDSQYDYMLIDDEKYQIDNRKAYRRKTTFEVSGL